MSHIKSWSKSQYKFVDEEKIKKMKKQATYWSEESSLISLPYLSLIHIFTTQVPYLCNRRNKNLFTFANGDILSENTAANID